MDTPLVLWVTDYCSYKDAKRGELNCKGVGFLDHLMEMYQELCNFGGMQHLRHATVCRVLPHPCSGERGLHLRRPVSVACLYPCQGCAHTESPVPIEDEGAFITR